MVRYAYGPTTKAHLTVASPPAVVWAVITDIDLPARFSDEFAGADWLDGTVVPALGTRFHRRIDNEHVGQGTVTCTVTELELERLFEWTVNDVDNPAVVRRREIEPTEDGCTVHQRARLAPGPSGVLGSSEADPDARGPDRGLSAGHVGGEHAAHGRGHPGSRAVTGVGQPGQWARVP
jgi:hypothetical protein